MKIAVFAYSRTGCGTAKNIIKNLDAEVKAFAPERIEAEGFDVIEKPAKDFYGKLFNENDALIFVGATGIAVREIAPHVKDKKTDPAVVCVDELGTFVISLLAGHIGGANVLTNYIAGCIGATPVVTTATDINGKFSVDAWASRNGFAISSMLYAKNVSAAILEGDVPLCSDLEIKGSLPNGTVDKTEGPLGIYIGWSNKEPFEKTLRLVPKCLHLGLGCRRDTPKAAIEEAVEMVLKEYNIDKRAIKCAASVDLKANEAGLLEYCKDNGLPVTFYTSEELLTLKGEFSFSERVKNVAGVDCVCERSAMMGAEKLLVKKTALNGVTVAIATERSEVHFG